MEENKYSQINEETAQGEYNSFFHILEKYKGT